MFSVEVTLLVFQESSGWLKAGAEANIAYIVVTLLTSHEFTWLIEVSGLVETLTAYSSPYSYPKHQRNH
jgi:hypothetical protein